MLYEVITPAGARGPGAAVRASVRRSVGADCAAMNKRNLGSARRVVVKIGTGVLTDARGRFDAIP